MNPNLDNYLRKFNAPEKARNNALILVLAYLDSHSGKIRSVLKQLGSILKASWITIVIILLILALTLLDQSDTIVVDLLDHKPVNFTLFVYLLMILALIVSHYPVYLEINKYPSSLSHLQWHLTHIFAGWGFVTFKYRNFPQRSRLIGHIRDLWGLLLLVAVFYILLVVHSRNVEVYYYPEKEVRIWLVLQILLYLLFSIGIYRLIFKLCAIRYRRYRRPLINLLLAIFILVFVITAIAIDNNGWSRTTYWWTYALLWAGAPLYSAVRMFRKNTRLRNALHFLIFIAVGGFTSLGTVVYAHYFPFELNPLVILLAQLILLYGFFIIPIKHYYYYRQSNYQYTFSLRRLFFVWTIPTLLPLLLLWSVVSGQMGNDLHLLKTIPENPSETVDFRQFVEDFDNRFSEQDTLYFIASFGGGLKANIWNQLILDSLSNYKGQNLLSKTVAVSGVSGGSIGHAVFAGLYNQDTLRHQSHKEQIRQLGERNFLSIDLTYLLGRDLLLELVPGKIYPEMGKVKDRAKLAMHGYNNFIGGDSAMLGKTFRSFWGSLYQKEKAAGRFFPAMISNSAGTHIQRGIACSVHMPDTIFKSTFYDSSDLLSFRGDTSSLPFLYAASCSNRFPIFSPAAKVREKGHFIDGGYFENSGMLSLLDFYNTLRRYSARFAPGQKPPKVVFIQIANGKEEYLKSLLNGSSIQKTVKESSELSSILGTVTSISFFPSYFMKKNSWEGNADRADEISYVQIHLPYYVLEKDIRSTYKASDYQLDDTSQEAIRQSNGRIVKMVKDNRYELLQPPLARLLGRQSVNYMQAALEDSTTWENLNRVLKP
jgi:hypothetical protein